jgi:TPR repeat protein
VKLNALTLPLLLLSLPTLSQATEPPVPLNTQKDRCESGDAAACLAVGDRYERGSGVAQDPLHASLAFRQACDGGNAEACFRLGRMHERGSAVAQDLVQATDLFRKGCKAGYAPACEKIDGYVERAEKSDGKDAKNRPALKLGPSRPVATCEAGNLESCYVDALGLYFGQEGKEKDPPAGKALLKKTCDQGYDQACQTIKALKD